MQCGQICTFYCVREGDIWSHWWCCPSALAPFILLSIGTILSAGERRKSSIHPCDSERASEETFMTFFSSLLCTASTQSLFPSLSNPLEKKEEE